MTATALDDRAVASARPALDGPGRAALRDRIRAELARARPRPVAVRTLELLAEAAVDPCAGEPGYRILDRHGAPRLHERAGGDGPVPMTLADLVAELQARHAALFLPTPPPPEPEPPPVEAKDSVLLAGATEMRAATARFVETQSERARSLAERSSLKGRALARSAAGAASRFRARSGPTPAPTPTLTPADAHPVPAPDPVAAWNVDRGRFGRSLREGLDRLRGPRSGSPDGTGRLHRRWLVGAGAAASVAVVAAGLVVAGRDGTQAPSAPRALPPASEPAPAQTARAPAAPDTVTPPPESTGDPEPDAPALPPPPNAVTGTVQVIDTATLRIGGKLVHLFGVEWVRGGQADELARYIAGRPVTCQPAPGSENMNCTVDGRDLSEVVLFNGGGRASPEASPELVAAEDHARSERLGVWKR